MQGDVIREAQWAGYLTELWHSLSGRSPHRPRGLRNGSSIGGVRLEHVKYPIIPQRLRRWTLSEARFSIQASMVA